MKQIVLLITILASICSHVGNGKEKTVKNTIPACSDMVLIYGGGKQRTLVWNEDRFLPYVCYKDTSDVEHWFFDGFLFLELSTQSGNTPQHVFATDYKGIPANKADWTAQADYYFTHGISIDALDKCIGKTARKIGKPITKRKVIIALPEPIVAGEGTMYADVMDSCYWGAINGKPLNFGNKADRIAAVKWYIDLIRSRFQAEKFKHVELAGFYWTPEHTRHTRDLLDEIGLYLNNLKYSFNWIPYFNPKPDYYEWNTLGFHYAYLQPNYFFRENVPYSRLEEACQRAEKYGLNLEFEFDNRAMKDNKNWGYRLRNYIKAYRESGLLPLKRIAYYQGGDGAMYQLLHSSNKEDVDLYHEFCRFVLEHQSLYHN